MSRGGLQGRRTWAAQIALERYREAKNGSKAGKDEADFRDLLTDLMHYAKREGIDFADQFGIAERNFEAETGK